MNDWLLACEVIGESLRELRPDLTDEQVQHNAAAIIARLAHKDLLIVFSAAVKDGEPAA